MITKAHLEGLKAGRRKLTLTLDYTPTHSIIGQIGFELDMKREQTIRDGELALKHASNNLQQQFGKSRLQGKVKIDFNHSL